MQKFSNDMAMRDFLKNESKRLNIDISNVYRTYFSRLLLERISMYDDKSIIVKGSFAQFVHLNRFVRPITDVDITSIKGHHEPFITLVQAMCDSQNDMVTFEFRKKPYQSRTGIYKIPLVVNFGKIFQPVDIDYRENHPCIFECHEMVVPKVFTGDDEYSIIVPSLEETLAEKLCIILESHRSDILNTRVKDFYDIYQLHGGKYDLDKFSYYFEKMLDLRGKVTPEFITTKMLNEHFIKNHEEEWERSSKKYEFLDKDITLYGAVYYTRGVLSEQIQKIEQGKNKNYVLHKS